MASTESRKIILEDEFILIESAMGSVFAKEGSFNETVVTEVTPDY